MVFELDKIDRKILVELSRNARSSHKEIASICRIAKSTVTFRIARLKEQGIIRNFKTLTDASAQGILYARLSLVLHSTPSAQELEQLLHKIPSLSWAAKVYGDFDLALVIQGSNLHELASAVSQIHSLLGTYIARQECSLAYKIHYCALNVLFSTQFVSPIEVTYSNSLAGIPELHRKILNTLIENPLISILALADKNKLSSKKALQVKRQLESQGIIKRYIPQITVSLLGFETHHLRWKLRDTDPHIAEIFVQYLLSLRETLYVTQVLGGIIESELVVENQRELFELIESIKQDFPQIVELEQNFLIYEILKS